MKISSDEKVLYLLRGPSGTGKSTIAKKLTKDGGVVLEADQYFTDSKGNYNFDSSKLGAAHRDCQSRFLESLKRRVSPIVVSNTSTTLSEMKFYVKNAISFGYEVKFLEPDWTPELKLPSGEWNVDFIEKQQQNPDRAKSNKTLPRSVIEKMVKRYHYNPKVEDILKSSDM